jgi:hypothetical protein
MTQSGHFNRSAHLQGRKARASEASYSISGSPEGSRSVDDRDAGKGRSSVLRPLLLRGELDFSTLISGRCYQ